MKKSSGSESGAFNPRIFAAFILGSIGAWLAMFSFASTPSSGTLSDTGSTVLTYDAGPFNASNPTPVLFLDSGPECFGTAQPCDDFALTATISSAYLAAHPNASIKVTAGWTDTGSG